MYYQLLDVTGSVPIRKGIFRTAMQTYRYMRSIGGSVFDHRMETYNPDPDLDILFEVSGDKSGLLIEIPWDMCRGKEEIGRCIDGRFETLKRAL